MTEDRIDGMTRRAAALGAGGLAAALLGTATGNAAKNKKPKKKPKPELREPLAFVAVAAVGADSSGGETPVINWDVNGTYFHPASTLQGEISGTFQTGFTLSPEQMRAQLAVDIRNAVAETLANQGRVVPSERISVTIL